MANYTCKICGSTEMYKSFDFGEMPSANNLVRKEDLEKVKSYPLTYYWCSRCTFFQQIQIVGREKLFADDYLYLSGVSQPVVDHYKELASDIKRIIQNQNFAIIIASNDGTEIAQLKRHSQFNKIIGVEPAKNLAAMANNQGLTTLNEFFTETLASKIVQENGKADLVMANNVFAHIPDPEGMLRGMKDLINDDGVILMEMNWLKNIVEELKIETLYAEHYYVWDVKALKELAIKCNLVITGIEHLKEQQGGSIRVLMKKHGEEKNVKEFMKEEEALGLYNKGYMESLQKRADERKRKLLDLINSLKKEGKSIALWTVPAKISTLLNFCGLTNKEINCAYDLTAVKIGKFIPRANIEIKDEKLIDKDMPDYLLVGAWNYMEFGKEKLKGYMEKGGKLINPLTLEIIP